MALRIEDAWCSGLRPPDVPPVYDSALAERIRRLERRDGHRRAFYNSAEWRRLRAKVLADFHGESLAELSASPARYVPATTVHHVMRVSRWPGWALSEWAVDEDGRVVRNLVPLSDAAHNLAHDRMLVRAAEPLTPERW